MGIQQNELYKRYKLSSADKAQVCDGGSWEDLCSNENTTASHAIEIANGLNYRPSRRKSSSGSRASRAADASFEEKQQDAPSFFPSASLRSDDGSMGFLDLSEKMDESERSKASAQSNRSLERRSSLPASTSSTAVPRTKSRRSSDGDTPKNKNVVLRKLSQPMHRSMSSATLSGIMRPSRYSSNNLADMNTFGERGRITSCLNLSTLQDVPPEENKLPRTSSATWVAHGVEFSKNMEVYVFKK